MPSPDLSMSCSACWTGRARCEPSMRRADQKSAFKRRVCHWADKLQVEYHGLAVRPMQNKWASCSTKGNLNFNKELLRFNQAVWDYVIVHELLHFFVPNHGRLWKSLMRAHLGDYESAAKKLQTASAKSLAKPV